jgi:hypothetical protein
MLWVVWCVAFVVWAVSIWHVLDRGREVYPLWALSASVSALTMVGVSLALAGVI